MKYHKPRINSNQHQILNRWEKSQGRILMASFGPKVLEQFQNWTIHPDGHVTAIDPDPGPPCTVTVVSIDRKCGTVTGHERDYGFW